MQLGGGLRKFWNSSRYLSSELVVGDRFYYQLQELYCNHNVFAIKLASPITYLFVVNSYMVPSISFKTFFVQAVKIVVDSSEFSMLLLYILWDGWPIFMISG